jgi:kynureninase
MTQLQEPTQIQSLEVNSHDRMIDGAALLSHMSPIMSPIVGANFNNGSIALPPPPTVHKLTISTTKPSENRVVVVARTNNSTTIQHNQQQSTIPHSEL